MKLLFMRVGILALLFFSRPTVGLERSAQLAPSFVSILFLYRNNKMVKQKKFLHFCLEYMRLSTIIARKNNLQNIY
jgi:hypothetical protein